MIVISQEVLDSALAKLPTEEVEKARAAVTPAGKSNNWYAWNDCFLSQIYRMRTGVTPDFSDDCATVHIVHEKGTTLAPKEIRECVPELTDSEFYALSYMDVDEKEYIDPLNKRRINMMR